MQEKKIWSQKLHLFKKKKKNRQKFGQEFDKTKPETKFDIRHKLIFRHDIDSD